MLHFVKQRDRFYVSFMYSPDHQLSIFGSMKNIHINFVEVILSVKQWEHMIDIILESSHLPTARSHLGDSRTKKQGTN